MVAVGSLKKIWLEIPQDTSEEKYKNKFKEYFGADWEDVLNAVDMSFAYNVYNSAYFSADDIKLVEGVTLDHLMKDKIECPEANIVVS